MKLHTPFSRFLIGLASILILAGLGFSWAAAAIPTQGATPAEISRGLPGDDLIPQPQLSWNHALTIHATPEQISPWLVQIGDTRGGFYSFTFIENLFMIAAKNSDRYVNAGRVHPEWQNPPIGQGMIMNYLAIQDYRPGEYVLASATPEMPGFQWTWLWVLQPLDQGSTRLLVRHRFLFPAGMPENLTTAVLDAGYVMERGMILGIRDRAEGRIPPGFSEPLGIVLWLAALVCGLIAAVRFIRAAGNYPSLGIGLAAVVCLFLFTFIQPALWLRVALDLALAGGLGIVSMPLSARSRTPNPRMAS